MKAFKGIQRAAIAVLAVLVAMPLPAVASLDGGAGDPTPHSRTLRLALEPSPTLQADAANPHRCASDDPANNWRTLRLVLAPAAIDGPPEMKDAAAALNRGNRDEAMHLLDMAARYYPSDTAQRESFYPPFLHAVLSAKVIAWLLRGCPFNRDNLPSLFWE